MRRFLLTSLASLLVMGSLGHVFAAAFCPRMLGHDCCLTKIANKQSSQPHQHMRDMATDGMATESMQMDPSDMSGMSMEDGVPPSSPSTIDNKLHQLPSSADFAYASHIAGPVDACTHCLSHSGMQNMPLSSVGLSDQSGKEIGSIRLPGSRFFGRPSMTLAITGLSREHSPPGIRALRHVLLNVFQI